MTRATMLEIALAAVLVGTSCRSAPPSEEPAPSTTVSERRTTRMITQHQTEEPILNDGADGAVPDPTATQPPAPQTPPVKDAPKPQEQRPQPPEANPKKPPEPQKLPDLPEEYQRTLDELTGQKQDQLGRDTSQSSLLDLFTLDDEIALGELNAATIAAQGVDESDPGLLRYLNLIAAVLAGVSDRPEMPCFVAILNDASVNAFSAPGGFLFVTRGALRAAHDEAELAAILAHEIAHCALRHAVRMLAADKYDFWKQQALARMDEATEPPPDPELVRQMEGMIDDILKTMRRGYSVQLEEEADRAAALYLWRAGYQATAMIDLLQSLDRESPGKRPLASHPPVSERIAKLNALFARSPDWSSGKRMQDRFRANVSSDQQQKK